MVYMYSACAPSIVPARVDCTNMSSYRSIYHCVRVPRKAHHQYTFTNASGLLLGLCSADVGPNLPPDSDSVPHDSRSVTMPDPSPENSGTLEENGMGAIIIDLVCIEQYPSSAINHTGTAHVATRQGRLLLEVHEGTF